MTTKRKASIDSHDEQTSIKRMRESREVSPQSSEEDCLPRRRGRSQTRQRRAARAHTTPSIPSTPASEAMTSEDTSSDTDAEHETIASETISRIQAAIKYTRAQKRKQLHPYQTTRFKIPLFTPSYTPTSTEITAHKLLSSSSAAKVLSSPDFIVFELGMPIPYLVPEGAGVRLVHTPQWWIGKSIPEVKTRPHTEEKNVRGAVAHLKGLATKKRKKACKTAREKDIEHKLEEGLRRQEAGLPMHDDD